MPVTKIDWYVMKKFLVTFFFTAFLFTLISVVVDISQRVEKFIESGVTTQMIITDYYLPFIPWINGILWPLFALMAVVFFTSRLAKNSEIIAILSTGVSFNRFLRPYLLVGGFLALLLYIGNHDIVPRGTRILRNFMNTYIDQGGTKTKAENVHIFLDPNSKVSIRNYRRSDTSMRGVYLEHFRDGELVTLVRAERMRWSDAPSVWSVSDYQIRTFDGEDETITNGQGQSFDTLINLVPNDFVRYKNQRETMTSRELRDFIDYENRKGFGKARKMVTELHRRNAEPVTLIILTIMGAAIAARKVRGGVGVHLALGVTVGALYIVLSRFSITFANQLNLPIGISVWLPNIVFSFVAAWLVFRAQK
jgi:lipopolysaccharide export system permease protein